MEGQNVQALERAFDVLETLSETHGGIGLSTLAQKTGLSKSTAHRILKTMLERGYAEKTLDGSYKLGSHLFELMSNHIDSLELQVEAQPYMAALERALHLPAYLGVLDRRTVRKHNRQRGNPQSRRRFHACGQALPRPLLVHGQVPACLPFCRRAGRGALRFRVRSAHGQHHHPQARFRDASAAGQTARMGDGPRRIRAESSLRCRAHFRFQRQGNRVDRRKRLQ